MRMDSPCKSLMNFVLALGVPLAGWAQQGGPSLAGAPCATNPLVTYGACQFSLGAAPDRTAVTVNTSSAGYAGSITASCSNATWSFSQASCLSTTCVATTVTSDACSYSLPVTAHGKVIAEANRVDGYAGKFQGTCLNASWTMVNMTCKPLPARLAAQCQAGLIFNWGGNVARQTTLTELGKEVYQDLEMEYAEQGLDRWSYGLCYGRTEAAVAGQSMSIFQHDHVVSGSIDVVCDSTGTWVPVVPVRPGFTVPARTVSTAGGTYQVPPIRVPPYMGDATCGFYRGGWSDSKDES